MKTVTHDDESESIYTVPVGQCNQHTSVEDSKYEEKRKNALIGPGESISKMEPINRLENKTMRLYIVTGAPTLFCQQGNHKSCILLSLASVLHYMGDGYVSEYIIRRKQKYLLVIQNKGRMHFCRDIIMGNHKLKNEKRLNYRIEEWHISTPYDISRNQSNYPTVCLLLDMWKRTDHCITVCCIWIFDTNIEVAFPLTQDSFNYICRGNDTYENKCFGVLHEIREVPPDFFSKNIKYEIIVINYHHHWNHQYIHCSNFYLPHIHHG